MGKKSGHNSSKSMTGSSNYDRRTGMPVVPPSPFAFSPPPSRSDRLAVYNPAGTPGRQSPSGQYLERRPEPTQPPRQQYEPYGHAVTVNYGSRRRSGIGRLTSWANRTKKRTFMAGVISAMALTGTFGTLASTPDNTSSSEFFQLRSPFHDGQFQSMTAADPIGFLEFESCAGKNQNVTSAADKWRCDPSASKQEIAAAIANLKTSGAQLCPTGNEAAARISATDQNGVLCVETSSILTGTQTNGDPIVMYSSVVSEQSAKSPNAIFDDKLKAAGAMVCAQSSKVVDNMFENYLLDTPDFPDGKSVPVMMVVHSTNEKDAPASVC